MTELTDPLRRTIADNTTAPELVAMTEKLALLRIRLETAEDEAKRIRGDYEAVEHDLFDALENAGMRQMRTEWGLFTLNDLAWAHVTDPEAARAWADQQLPDLLSLNQARLSKIVRDRLKEGGELPPGVDFRTSRKITWRRQ